MFFFLLNVAINKLNESFELLENHNSCFSFLHNLAILINLNLEEKLKYCVNLENKLTDFRTKNSVITAEDLLNKIEILPSDLKFSALSANILEYIFKNNLINVFPNLIIALRIYLTLPVPVAEGERSFSKLKIIKNYLRSTMSQERLSNFEIISIENKTNIRH